MSTTTDSPTPTQQGKTSAGGPAAMQRKKTSKRDTTRRRVIEAAVECIASVGFNASHTNRIAETAAVSWGVLQYHFGDKDGLLNAVLEYIFEDFSASLEQADFSGHELHGRVSELVELVWSLVGQREYRVSLAILRNAGKDDASNIDAQTHITRWAERVSQLWDETFAEFELDPQRSHRARRLMFAALRGMADEINAGSRDEPEQREALADAITYLLQHQTTAGEG